MGGYQSVMFTGLKGELMMIDRLGIKLRKSICPCGKQWIQASIHLVQARSHRLPLLPHHTQFQTQHSLPLFTTILYIFSTWIKSYVNSEKELYHPIITNIYCSNNIYNIFMLFIRNIIKYIFLKCIKLISMHILKIN